MITNKRLLILWGIIIVAYAAIIVLTWPGLTVSSDERVAIYHDYLAAIDMNACEVAQERLIEVAAAHHVTDREAVFAVREGLKAANMPDPCGRYYP